jgi:hypothetical protein
MSKESLCIVQYMYYKMIMLIEVGPQALASFQ